VTVLEFFYKHKNVSSKLSDDMLHLFLLGLAFFRRTVNAELIVPSTNRIGDATKSAIGSQTEVLSTGDYVLGGHTGGSVAITLNSIDGTDMFVRKYSSAGAVLWARQFGTSGNDRFYFASGIAVDSNDSTYAVGSCIGAIGATAPVGNLDACYFTLDTNGNQLCAGQLGGLGDDVFNGVIVDSINQVFYAVGMTATSDFDGHTKSGTQDPIIIQFSRLGSCDKLLHIQSAIGASTTTHICSM